MLARIEQHEIVLEHGSIPTSPEHVHVHCATAGLRDNPPVAIFTDSTITLQPISRISLSLAAGLIGFGTLFFLRVGREEALMTETFGDEYRRYMSRTARILPGIY